MASESLAMLSQDFPNESGMILHHHNVLRLWMEKIDNYLPSGSQERFRTALNMASRDLPPNDEVFRDAWTVFVRAYKPK